MQSSSIASQNAFPVATATKQKKKKKKNRKQNQQQQKHTHIHTIFIDDRSRERQQLSTYQMNPRMSVAVTTFTMRKPDKSRSAVWEATVVSIPSVGKCFVGSFLTQGSVSNFVAFVSSSLQPEKIMLQDQQAMFPSFFRALCVQTVSGVEAVCFLPHTLLSGRSGFSESPCRQRCCGQRPPPLWQFNKCSFCERMRLRG